MWRRLGSAAHGVWLVTNGMILRKKLRSVPASANENTTSNGRGVAQSAGTAQVLFNS